MGLPRLPTVEDSRVAGLLQRGEIPSVQGAAVHGAGQVAVAEVVVRGRDVEGGAHVVQLRRRRRLRRRGGGFHWRRRRRRVRHAAVIVTARGGGDYGGALGEVAAARGVAQLLTLLLQLPAQSGKSCAE